MSYKYFPHTEEDIRQMVAKVGVDSLDDLYAEVPEEIRFKGDYDIPSEMSEPEVRRLFDTLGAQNRQLTCFAGAGVYDHYMPAVVPSILARSEYLTSYTPLHFRVSVDDGRTHGYGDFQCLYVRRFHRHG